MNTCELCNNRTDEELERCDECGRKCCLDCLRSGDGYCSECAIGEADELDDEDDDLDDEDFDLDEDAWPEGDEDDDDEAFD